MPQHPPGPFPLPGVSMSTWLVRFDKDGVVTSPGTRAALIGHVASEPPTDILLFSHGWNNEFTAATTLYAAFLQQFEKAVAAHPPPRPFSPLFVGVIWPSTWLTADDGPQLAGAAPPHLPDADRVIVEEMADAVRASGSVDDLARFYALMERDTLTRDESHTLAAILAAALGEIGDDEAGGERSPPGADDVLRAAEALQIADRAVPAGDVNLDDFGGVGGGVSDAPETAGLLSRLDPRRFVRVFSVYQMKDRAGVVGARGVGALVRDLLGAGASRLHLVGHSYGGKVVLSATCAPAALPRPISSLLLLQPAVSHLCFAEVVAEHGAPGGYRSALDPARVQPPVLTTYSRKDTPLHKTFHLSLRRASDLGEMQIAGAPTTAGNPPSRYAALGGYGPRGAGEVLVDPMPMFGQPYGSFGTAAIIGLDGSADIVNGHGDVSSPATAWALYRQVFR